MSKWCLIHRGHMKSHGLSALPDRVGEFVVGCVKFFQNPSSHLEKQDKALLKLQPGDLVAQNPDTTTLADCSG